MAEVASRRPISAVNKARQGCGHDVHNRRSGQGWPICRPHGTDDQVEDRQSESVRSSRATGVGTLLRFNFSYQSS